MFLNHHQFISNFLSDFLFFFGSINSAKILIYLSFNSYLDHITLTLMESLGIIVEKYLFE